MTTENKGITEVQALTNALNGQLDEETVAKLNHMIEVRSRKRERKTDDSKRLANIELGNQFAASFEGDTFKAADVAKALNVSTSKACAIIRAMEWTAIPSTEKVKVYSL